MAMQQQKYVRTEAGEIIIFPETITHSELKWLRKITSAGFCRIVGGSKVICYGESVSLNLKASPDDSNLATLQIFGLDAALRL